MLRVLTDIVRFNQENLIQPIDAMIAHRLLFSLVLVTLTVPAAAQESGLSIERIWGSTELESDLVPVRWIDDEFYAATEENGDVVDLYRVHAETGDRELLVRGAELIPPGATDPIRIEGYEFSSDRSRLLIYTNSIRVWRQNTKGEYYVWDFEEQRLLATATRDGYQQFAKFSPDGRLVGFVRDNDLFVTDLQTGRETQITSDGSEDIINGTSDWVYEEELGLRDAFRFSPDGSRIAFWRLDQTAIKPFYLIDELKLYPELLPVRYPKAGDQNSTVQIGVVEIGTGETTWVDIGSDPDIYIARLDFADSSDEIWLTRLNRHQNRLELMITDVRTGESRVIMTDEDDAWVDSRVPLWIDDGREFLYLSDRDGFTHLFHFRRDGELIRKVTSGEWDVRSVHGVNEREGVVYFTASANTPLEREVYAVGLDGRNLRRVTPEPGSHSANFNTNFTRFVDTHSTAASPPVQTLRGTDGSILRTVAANRELNETIGGLGMVEPEFLVVPGDEGVELNAFLLKPPHFDPSQQYPLLMYVYGGPGSQTVNNSWGGTRYLWHQMLAQQGYLVASVDNRGTGGRGVRFKKQTYLNLGQFESADQIAVAKYFASLPYVDESRIGIWGWSYGGYMSSLSMLRGQGVFRAAISVAPVTDWRLYDTIYTERFMRTPQENPEGYRKGAPIEYADQLQGELLLVHGTGDDNVHSQQTTQLVEALIQADKQFDMRSYPNRTHSIAGGITRVNLYQLFTSWLWENLYSAPAGAPIP